MTNIMKYAMKIEPPTIVAILAFFCVFDPGSENSSQIMTETKLAINAIMAKIA